MLWPQAYLVKVKSLKPTWDFSLSISELLKQETFVSEYSYYFRFINPAVHAVHLYLT